MSQHILHVNGHRASFDLPEKANEIQARIAELEAVGGAQ